MYGSGTEKICNQKVKFLRIFITIIKIQKTLVTFRKRGVTKLWFKAHEAISEGKLPTLVYTSLAWSLSLPEFWHT